MMMRWIVMTRLVAPLIFSMKTANLLIVNDLRWIFFYGSFVLCNALYVNWHNSSQAMNIEVS